MACVQERGNFFQRYSRRIALAGALSSTAIGTVGAVGLADNLHESQDAQLSQTNSDTPKHRIMVLLFNDKNNNAIRDKDPKTGKREKCLSGQFIISLNDVKQPPITLTDKTKFGDGCQFVYVETLNPVDKIEFKKKVRGAWDVTGFNIEDFRGFHVKKNSSIAKVVLGHYGAFAFYAILSWGLHKN